MPKKINNIFLINNNSHLCGGHSMKVLLAMFFWDKFFSIIKKWYFLGVFLA